MGDITDPTGMASTKLAEAVGYPGSSVAFAQLLSGMERDGLVIREVRGKRTYRITLPEGVAAAYAAKSAGRMPASAAAAPDVLLGASEVSTALGSAADLAGVVAAGAGASGAPSGVDYDELARRLLVQVLRKLASPSVADAVTGAGLGAVDAEAAVSEHPGDSSAAERAAREKTAGLEETVASLERELSAAWTRHGTLTAENARLREQLGQAQRALELERARRTPLAGELNEAEVVVLERLLDPPPGEAAPEAEEHPGATA